MAWSLSHLVAACMHNVHYAHVTACDSIGLGHVKKCLFGNFGSDVQGGPVGRASIFHAKNVGLNLALVTFFLVFFSWILLSCGFKSHPGHFFSFFFLLSDNSF